MKIIFRVDSSLKKGSGHLIRCLTLAKELKKKNIDIKFLCREEEGNLIDLVKSSFNVDTLKSINFNEGVSIYEKELYDIENVTELLKNEKPNLTIIDNYNCNIEWEKTIAPFSSKIMVIDDFLDREHYCDIFLNQNILENDNIINISKKNTTLLLGPDFALMDPIYASHRNLNKKRNKNISKIFIYFGGSDLYGLSYLTLKALTDKIFNEIEVDLVINENTAKLEKIYSISKFRPKTNIYNRLPHLANLMMKADLSLGSGGSTTWERLCLGLKSIVITSAENQVYFAKKLNSIGVINLLGDAKEVDENIIKSAIIDEIDKYELNNKSIAAMNICDGNGLSRVVNELYNKL